MPAARCRKKLGSGLCLMPQKSDCYTLVNYLNSANNRQNWEKNICAQNISKKHIKNGTIKKEAKKLTMILTKNDHIFVLFLLSNVVSLTSSKTNIIYIIQCQGSLIKHMKQFWIRSRKTPHLSQGDKRKKLRTYHLHVSN